MCTRKFGRKSDRSVTKFHVSSIIESMHRLYIAIAIISLFAWSAQAEDTESIREACRKQVAGAYLSAYNQWSRTSDYLILLDNQFKKLKAAEKAARTTFETRRNEVDKFEYDVERQRAFMAAQNTWEGIKTQLRDTQNLIEHAKDEAATADKDLRKLKSSLTPVFNIETIKRDSKEFPYRLEFISPCPKYRQTCPLPNAYAYLLKDISIAGTECQQYITFSLGMNRK